MPLNDDSKVYELAFVDFISAFNTIPAYKSLKGFQAWGQGDVLLPLLFFLLTDSFTSCHSRLLKYTVDFVIGKSYSKGSDQEELDQKYSRFTSVQLSEQ